MNVVPSFRGGIENKIIRQIACIMTQVERVWKILLKPYQMLMVGLAGFFVTSPKIT